MPQFRTIAVGASAAAALLFTSVIAPAATIAETPKQSKQSCKTKQKQKKCQPEVREGRMTGHGQVFDYAGFKKVQWEFRNSVCMADRFPDLKVEFGGNKFVLTNYTTPLRCIDTPADEGNPKAGFDTITTQGTGTLNGVSGAGITFRFTDAGEPGVNDTASFTITRPAPDGSPAIVVDNVAIQDGGNHQAHRK